MKSSMKDLLSDIRELIVAARKTAVRSIDFVQVFTNFEIGRRIVEHEQQGKERAEYGKEIIKVLAERLTVEFGKGFSASNLAYMRTFFLLYQERLHIFQPATGKLESDGELLPDSIKSKESEKFQSLTGKSQLPNILAEITGLERVVSGKFRPFSLSWTHYVFLLGIKDADERSFYEIEAANQNWSVRELKRQFNSGLYERLALSRDKDGLRKLAMEGQIISRPEDLIKEPYILEFLGIDEKAEYSESDLESAIIDKLEHFLLELGKGFLFEARQKRFTFDEEHFFVDLVFYNRLLHCYVLLDLKIGKLSHQNLGQMQMYVNYFDRFVKLPDENPTVGIILCKKKHDALVEITLPKDANIHAKEYQLYLPDKELLRQKLAEWSCDEKEKQ